MKLSDCDCVGIRDVVTEAGSDGQMASGLISPHPAMLQCRAMLWRAGFDTWSETLWQPAFGKVHMRVYRIPVTWRRHVCLAYKCDWKDSYYNMLKTIKTMKLRFAYHRSIANTVFHHHHTAFIMRLLQTNVRT